MKAADYKIDYGVCGKYSFGGIGYSMTNMFVITYLTFFCTDIFGVSSRAVAGLMLVTQIIDAITDPLMGIIADHTRTKYGRYRPYLMFGAPILGLCIYVLFSAPQLSEGMKVIFMYGAYIAYSLAFTAVGIPFTALVPIVGGNPVQRATLVSWKNVMIQVGRMIITSFSLPAVEILGGGVDGWRRYGMAVGIVITLCFWMVAWSAKPYDSIDFKKKREKLDIGTEIKLITKNRSLLMLMIAFGTDMVANSALLAVNVYYFKYVAGREDLVPVTSIALTAAGILSNLFIPHMIRLWEKKWLYWFGSLFSIVPLVILWIKPVMPAEILIILIAVFGIISTLPSALAWIMLSDCIDYSSKLVGVEGSGVVSSTFSFISKFGGAIGASAASWLLGMAGFQANQVQTAGVLSMIVFLRFGLPVLGYVASLISMYFYELTEKG